jgi:inorganic pyrophosphatase
MKITAGKNPPKEVNVLIEIPQGSSVKYEFDKEMEAMVVDRFAFTAMFYPFNYGYIPETNAEDGDPIDVLVLSNYPVYPGTVIPSRAVGMLEMEDEAGIDTKILAVPLPKVDPFMAHIKEIDDVPKAVKNQIKHFFEYYKKLEPGKWVKVKEWRGRGEAEEAIKKSLK